LPRAIVQQFLRKWRKGAENYVAALARLDRPAAPAVLDSE